VGRRSSGDKQRLGSGRFGKRDVSFLFGVLQHDRRHAHVIEDD